MVDPLTVLGAVSTTLHLIKVIWDTAKWMQEVYETMTHGDKTLQSISLECHIYGDSIKTIGKWMKENQTTTGLKRQIGTTHNAITLVKCSMQNLHLDLKKMQNGGKKISSKDRSLPKEILRIKLLKQSLGIALKRQWFQQTMVLHLTELRAHTATLHLTLSVIEL